MNKIRLIALAVVLAGILTSCEGCDDTYTPHYTNPATITLSFGKVTISTSDPYTAAEWNATVASLVTALNAAYKAALYKGDYDTVFGGDGAQIVLENNLANNWEVKAGTQYGTLHIKTSSINSITAASYDVACEGMLYNNNATSVTNAAPAQRGVFLAGGVNHGGQRGKAA